MRTQYDSGMYGRLCSILLTASFAAIAGPLSFAISQASKPDPGHVYLIVGSTQTLSAALTLPGVREIGPSRAPFARIVQTSTGFHASLVESQYWVFPATPLAELCGIRLAV